MAGDEPGLAPRVLAMILGPVIDASLRHALTLHAGDIGAVILRPRGLILCHLRPADIVFPPAARAIRRFR